MTTSRFWRSLALLLLAAAVIGTARAETVQVGVGQQRVITTKGRIGRVALGDPKIAGVNVLSIHTVLLTGKKRGDTSLLVWPHGRATSKPMRYAIVVGSGDLPDVLLDSKRGEVGTQVQTDITVSEVSRTALRQIGFNFINNPISGQVGGIFTPGTSGGVQFGTRTNGAGKVLRSLNPLSATAFRPIGDAFNLLLSDSDQDVAGLLSILERRGLMHILAKPTLVAMSGQTAHFLAGGEFPIPVVQSGGNNGSITIQFKEFGIRLSLTPTVLSNKRIVLKVAPEVSELDFTSGVTVQGVAVPGVRVRRTDTTIELGNGESFIISGLVDQNLRANVDKIPFLGDIPILGAFFRSTSFNRQDRELIMVVTPHIVTPLAPNTKIPIPGQKYDKYNPGSGKLFFLESGDFDTPGETGFTR